MCLRRASVLVTGFALLVVAPSADALHGHPRHHSGSQSLHPKDEHSHRGTHDKKRHVHDAMKKLLLGNNSNASLNASIPVMVNNNLGGLGPVPFPETHFMSMVVGNMARIGGEGGTPISLVLMNLTEYKVGDISQNGMYLGKYPAVNVYSTSNVTLRAIFVNNATGQRVRLKKFIWSALSLDCNADSSGAEQIIAKDFTSYRVHDSTSLKVEKMKDGSTSFLATTRNSLHIAPRDPLFEDPAALASTVAFEYNHVSEFEFTLQVKGPPPPNPGVSPYSRTFKFTGISEPMLDELRESEVRTGIQDVEISTPTESVWILLFLLLLLPLAVCCCLVFVCGGRLLKAR